MVQLCAVERVMAVENRPSVLCMFVCDSIAESFCLRPEIMKAFRRVCEAEKLLFACILLVVVC